MNHKISFIPLAILAAYFSIALPEPVNAAGYADLYQNRSGAAAYTDPFRNGQFSADAAGLISRIDFGYEDLRGYPGYVVTGGSWFEATPGFWGFASGGRQYAGEWAAIVNPYADWSGGQAPFDWFLFNGDGQMVTGWFEDGRHDLYYLDPDSTRIKGRMVTGWKQIGGCWYYFREVSDGRMGAMERNTALPDGSVLNAQGQLVENGIPVTAANAKHESVSATIFTMIAGQEGRFGAGPGAGIGQTEEHRITLAGTKYVKVQ